MKATKFWVLSFVVRFVFNMLYKAKLMDNQNPDVWLFKMLESQQHPVLFIVYLFILLFI